MLFFLISLIFTNDFIKTPCGSEEAAILYKDAEKSFNTKKLDFLLDYCNVHPRKIFKLCRKNQKDCSYYKGRIFEFLGNTKDAMDLYLRSSKYERYLYLHALNAKDPSSLFEQYKVEDNAKIFILASYYFSKGDWDEVIKNNILIKNISEEYKAKLIFLIAYSYIMKGDLYSAKNYLTYKFDNFYYNLEIKKIEAVLSYANNDQNTALKIIKEILKYNPIDSLVLKYYAEINFRLGFFDQASKTIDALISRETRDTEKFYLLKEKAFMLLRYDFLKKSLLLFDSVLEEYSTSSELIYEYIALLVNYSFVKEADKYIEKLKYINKYFYYLSLSLKEDYFYNLEASLSYLELANKEKTTKELLEKIKLYKKIISFEGKNKKIKCTNYKINKLKDDILQIKKNESVYFIKKHENVFNISILVNFIYREGINNNIYKMKNFIKEIEKFWSTENIKLNIIEAKGNTVKFDYFPSSLYIKRADSSFWPILLNKRIYFHEVGHLIGLDDEYYETNPNLSFFNSERFIGNKSSIMKNILSGNIEKKHIESILYPVLNCEAKIVE